MISDLHDKQMELTGPGRRLMEARNALNLSREDVAQKLKLKLKTIIAIEEDRVDELPAPMYVMGYLRNYAKVLKIPHEPIIDSFEQLQVEAPPIISDVVKPHNNRKARKLVKWGSITITIVLLAGFFSWLVKQDFDFGGPTRVADEATVSGDVVSDAQQASEAPGSEISETLPLEASQAAIPASSEAVEEVAKQPEIIALPPEDDKIVLSLNDDCWVEIIDASGKKVVFDLLKKGSQHTLYARAPYNVFLGNAAAVSMSVNDKPYDIAPHIRGKLARFKVAASNGA